MFPEATTLGARRHHCSGLLLAERGGDLRLIEVISAGAAATDLSIRQLAKFHAGNAAQQLARLPADALRMREVAGIVIGDLAWKPSAGRRLAQAEPLEKHAHIEHALAERFRARLVRRAREHEVILVHGGAAAGGIGEDGLHIERESVEVAPGKGLRGPQISGVPGQPAAAALPGRRHHLYAVAREHLDGGRVDVGIEHALRATQQQGDAGAAFSASRRHHRPALRGGNLLGHQIEHRLERRRRHWTEHFAKLPQPRGHPEPCRKRNGLRGNQPPEPFAQRPLHHRLRERAKWTDEIAIGHAAGAGRFARQATQATVHVRLRRRQRQRAFEHLFHQHDTPARRIHLLSQLAIRGACRQAKAAMHAGLHRAGHRRPERPERLRWDLVQHQSSREGNRCTGSSAFFTAGVIAGCGRRPSQSGASPRKVTPESPSFRRHS